MKVEIRTINNNLHDCKNYQKRAKMPNIKMFLFKPKSEKPQKEEPKFKRLEIDLQILIFYHLPS